MISSSGSPPYNWKRKNSTHTRRSDLLPQKYSCKCNYLVDENFGFFIQIESALTTIVIYYFNRCIWCCAFVWNKLSNSYCALRKLIEKYPVYWLLDSYNFAHSCMYAPFIFSFFNTFLLLPIGTIAKNYGNYHRIWRTFREYDTTIIWVHNIMNVAGLKIGYCISSLKLCTRIRIHQIEMRTVQKMLNWFFKTDWELEACFTFFKLWLMFSLEN